MSAIAYHRPSFDHSLSLLVNVFILLFSIIAFHCLLKRVKGQMMRGDVQSSVHMKDTPLLSKSRLDPILSFVKCHPSLVPLHSTPFHSMRFHSTTLHYIAFHSMGSHFKEKLALLGASQLNCLFLSSLPPHPLLPLPRDTRVSWAFDFQQAFSPLIPGTSRIYSYRYGLPPCQILMSFPAIPTGMLMPFHVNGGQHTATYN